MIRVFLFFKGGSSGTLQTFFGSVFVELGFGQKVIRGVGFPQRRL